MKKQNVFVMALFSMVLLLASCGEKTKQKAMKTADETATTKPKAPVYDANDSQSVLASIEYAQGGWSNLWNKKDVQYTYDYRYPDGKADVSTERYIFADETSFGSYTQNDINAMPGAKGTVTQCFDGKGTVVMVGDKKIEDPDALGGGEFLRRANYFWFVMPYKLNDSGTILKNLGKEEYKGTSYDKIEVTYDPALTGKEQNDIYILYVNPTTKMIDRFYFSLPFMGVNVPAIVANYEYEDIDGQKVATKRTYFMPNEKGEYGETPNIVQTLSNVKFNNGFTAESIMKM